jgi:hypothetical protein
LGNQVDSANREEQAAFEHLMSTPLPFTSLVPCW